MTPQGTALAFSVAEYRSRAARVQKGMAQLGLDALLCHSFASTCYLTGLQSVMGPAKYFMTVLPPEGDPFLLGQDFEMHNARLTSWVEDITGYPIFADPIEASRKLLRSRGLANKRLGLEMNKLCMSPAQFEKLKGSLADAQFVDASDLVPAVRAIKSLAEVECIRQACRISSRAMRAAMDAAIEGRTDNDIAAAAMEVCLTEGSEFLCLEPIVSIGPRSGVPHCTFARNIIHGGDLGFVEIGACIHRYSGPLIRTFSMGTRGLEEQRVADETEASLNAVLRSMRPGVTAAAVAEEGHRAWEWTWSNPALFWNGAYGYSVGIGFPSDWCDAWLFIREGDETILEPGMVFHCTNNVRKAGVFGVGISETVVVNESGVEVLTSFPRHLVIR